ncbi:alpha/beta fold hydrolase [Beijerinckia sp. L45]|uniref:alpha/beta fold hydrolase n=1 Tax=Beijerinckia sp. L45 TaxID=1641855 RepID=UPI00131D00DC|nr:alpha/beta hydrolase [Beijerinckia sp. L45]
MDLQKIIVADTNVNVFVGGHGKPLLILHDERGFDENAEHIVEMCKTRRLVVISIPGFDGSELPDWVDTVDDLSYICLSALQSLGIFDIDVLGCSIGGWIAVEMAVKMPNLTTKLALCGPLGIKTGPVAKLDIPDIFAVSRDEADRILFCNPRKAFVDLESLSVEKLTAMTRNRETTTLLGWEPYFHNPKLRRRLHRVECPTLFLHGAEDKFTSRSYIESYASLIPSASIIEVAKTGHFVHLEAPSVFVDHVLRFFDEKTD